MDTLIDILSWAILVGAVGGTIWLGEKAGPTHGADHPQNGTRWGAGG